MFFGPLNWNISDIYYQRSTYGVSSESLHSGEQKRLMVLYNICTWRAARGLKPVKKSGGRAFLDLKTGISLVNIIRGQHMGCLVKAGIQGNKKG